MGESLGEQVILTPDVMATVWADRLNGINIRSPHVAALWVMADPLQEEGLLAHVATAWCGMRWVGAVFSARDANELATDTGTKYPRFLTQQLASVMSTSMRMVSYCNSYAIDPRNPGLRDFYVTARRSRGGSGAIAILAHDSSVDGWLTAIDMLRVRRSIARDMKSLRELENVRFDLAGAYCSMAVACHFMPVIPLDLHPYAGFCVFGAVNDLVDLAKAAGWTPISNDAIIESFVNRGGGLIYT
jgi:hypothetical protein